MNKIIEPKIISKEADTDNHNNFIECSEELVPLFGECFSFIRSHQYLNCINKGTLPKDTLFVFPDLPFLTVNVVENITLPDLEIPDNEFDRDDNFSFFDWNEMGHSPEGLDVVKIFFRERVFGIYTKERNTLLTCDISHNHYCVTVANKLFPYLKEMLSLKKPAPVEVKKLEPLKTTVTVGCDPEFETVNSNGVTSAENYLRDSNCESEIGLDGAGDQIELRPKYGTPAEVVTHLHSLFNKFVREYPNLRLATSGHSYPLGGHIHIGVGFPLDPPKSLVDLLDDFIGKPTIHLSGYARGCYKSLSAWEFKPWGFEYRTPPAIIFQNKTITKIFLKLARNLVRLYINRGNNGGRIFYHSPLTKEDYKIVGGLKNEEVKYLLSFLHDMKKSVKKEELLIAAWGLNNTPMTITHDIKFICSDDWNPDCYREFIQTIKASLHGVNIDKDIYISLAGFRRDRGEVCNIPSEFIDKENECEYGERFYPVPTANKFLFYLPWSVRMVTNSPADIFYGVAREIGDFIKRYL